MIDYKKMLEDICDLVEDDFCVDAEMNLIPNSKTGKCDPFTQKQAEEMASRLAQIYSVAHCIHCKACQNKYLKK